MNVFGVYIVAVAISIFLYMVFLLKLRKNKNASKQQLVVCPECGGRLSVFSPTFKPFALVCRNPECKLSWMPKKDKEEDEEKSKE